jgi:hypothetical protein
LDDLTGIQIAEREQALEAATASALGRLLFEFSRLDMNLGLCLVWVGGGGQLQSLTEKVDEFGFSKRLEALEKRVEAFLPAGSKGRMEYGNWLRRAHEMRRIRNELVHGRWTVDPRKYEAVNIVGLPTSPGQREIRYSLTALESIVAQVKDLGTVLNKLRDRWTL